MGGDAGQKTGVYKDAVFVAGGRGQACHPVEVRLGHAPGEVIVLSNVIEFRTFERWVNSSIEGGGTTLSSRDRHQGHLEPSLSLEERAVFQLPDTGDTFSVPTPGSLSVTCTTVLPRKSTAQQTPSAWARAGPFSVCSGRAKHSRPRVGRGYACRHQSCQSE